MYKNMYKNMIIMFGLNILKIINQVKSTKTSLDWSNFFSCLVVSSGVNLVVLSLNSGEKGFRAIRGAENKMTWVYILSQECQWEITMYGLFLKVYKA